MQIDALKCFGAAPGMGNIALVVQGGPPSIQERQVLAAESRQPACVFLTEIASGLFEADYYYPHTRSVLCLHASLAAAHVLFGQAAQVSLRTAMRGQALALSRRDASVFVGVQAQQAPQIAIGSRLPGELLGVPDLALMSDPVIASVGSAKLLIEVADSATLHALQPPLEQVLAWGKAHGVNGCYAYCRVGERAYEGRNFNHLDPALEDSATGVAAGALSAHLGHGITLDQGKAGGNHCRIHTRVDGKDIFIGGAVWA